MGSLTHPHSHNSLRSYDYHHFTHEGTKAQQEEMANLSAQMREGEMDRWMNGQKKKIGSTVSNLRQKPFPEKKLHITFQSHPSTITAPMSPHYSRAHLVTLRQHRPKAVPSVALSSFTRVFQSPSWNPTCYKGLHTETHTHTLPSCPTLCFAFISIRTLITMPNTSELLPPIRCYAKLYMLYVLQSS